MKDKERNTRKIILIVAAAVLVLTLTLAGVAIQLTKQRADSPGNSQSASDLDTPPMEEEMIRMLVCGVDNTDMLTDVIMYAVFDVRKNTVNVLQIPRDSFVGADYPTGKINSVYGHPVNTQDGIKELEQVIEQQLNLEVDYYVTITLEGLRKVIDDLGGVEMDVPVQINYLPGMVLYPGVQTLNGEKAEWIVRYRAGYVNGDIGRVNMQKEFIKATMVTVKNKGKLALARLLMDNYSQIKTDASLDQLIGFATQALKLEPDNVQMYIAPGEGKYYGSYAVYELNKEELAQMLNDYFRPNGQMVDSDTINIKQVPYQERPQQPVQSGEGDEYQGENGNNGENLDGNGNNGENPDENGNNGNGTNDEYFGNDTEDMTENDTQ